MGIARPAPRLDDAEPVVGCEADIDFALAEMAEIEAKQRAVQRLFRAELEPVQAQLAEIEKRHAQHYLKPSALRLKQRAEKLLSAVVAFAREAKDSLLAGAKKGSKSREFTLGTIAFRLQPAKLKSRFEETSRDDLLHVLLDLFGVRAKVQDWLSTFTHCGLPLGEMVRVDYSWNVARILELAELKKITPEQLAEMGLAIEREPEKVDVKLTCTSRRAA